MTDKRKNKKSFWQRVRFKYTLSVINENNLESVFSIKLSKLSATLYVLGFAALLIILTSIVIISTPMRNYLPGYLDAEIRREMIENSLKTDSLEMALNIQTTYLTNINKIMRGDVTVDSVPDIDTLIRSTEFNFAPSEEVEDFLSNYEEEERYNLSRNLASQSIPDDIMFYRPVKGIISDHFNVQTKHYGVDIATSPKESILATMKGIVIFAGFDANAGYVIQLQHPTGFVSIYKHNSLLLKGQGDEVAAGEAIALAGNTGNLSSGAHLHFELWYKGYPIDPEEYIVF
jgi:Membrane proteins related to metalloendopeptidases